ncbi:acyltransferase [Pseudoclavibacter sp. RFBA6]|uniref:acyltransferase family protein n=1 Tax=Pseudoclavibacter sp. RFBA6 TaxID=2080573 RepID=UPI000CE9117F|nr:acyltransferase [Pseudoclavibacter sp. RFBA6]PPG39437.1 hypothetical protein C5C17_11625 [Pseudoclavibacter sp. RFBA6]
MKATLREHLSTQSNALNFIRLILASVVIFDHTWIIGGYAEEAQAPVATWAVNGFFAISGYLIAGSGMRLGFREFMTNRAFRILPAFWTVLILTAFVVSPIAAWISGETWQLGSAITYVTNNAALLITQHGISDTLAAAPYPDVWNGSLWTLFYEFAAYIGAGVLLSFAWARKHALPIVCALLAVLMIGQLLAHGVLDVEESRLVHMVRFAGFFAGGMVVYFLADKIRPGKRLAATAALVLAALFVFDVAEMLGQLPLAVLLLTLGAILPVRAGMNNDISYGIYIWAFPVQQFVILLGLGFLGPWGTGLLSFAVTVPLAWASWLWVEKPANNLRRHVPKRWYGKRPAAVAPARR